MWKIHQSFIWYANDEEKNCTGMTKFQIRKKRKNFCRTFIIFIIQFISHLRFMCINFQIMAPWQALSKHSSNGGASGIIWASEVNSNWRSSSGPWNSIWKKKARYASVASSSLTLFIFNIWSYIVPQ